MLLCCAVCGLCVCRGRKGGEKAGCARERDRTAPNALLHPFTHSFTPQPTASTPPSPHAPARTASTAAWRAVIIGDIPAAITSIRESAPSLLDNDEFRCALLTVRVVHCLSSGDRAAALALLRSELAPLALSTSPEAYTDFKNTLLLFTEAPPPPRSPPSDLLARSHLAGRVARSMREVAGVAAHPPALVAAVRYLCLCAHAAVGAPGVDPLPPSLADLVPSLAGNRQTPPDPSPASASITVAEAEVQALRQVLGVPRDAAAAAMRAAGGVASTALRVELDGRSGGEKELAELAWEHAAARGLGLEPVAGVAGTAAAAATAGHAAVHRLEAAAVAGDVDTVEAELVAIAPNALTNAPPAARFELAAARFRSAAARGDAPAALKLLRETLAPLADADPVLLPAVKAAAASLLPGGRREGEEGVCASPHLTTTTALRSALRAALNLPPSPPPLPPSHPDDHPRRLVPCPTLARHAGGGGRPACAARRGRRPVARPRRLHRRHHCVRAPRRRRWRFAPLCSAPV